MPPARSRAGGTSATRMALIWPSEAEVRRLLLSCRALHPRRARFPSSRRSPGRSRGQCRGCAPARGRPGDPAATSTGKAPAAQPRRCAGPVRRGGGRATRSASVSSSPVRSAGSGGIPAAGHIRVIRTRKFPDRRPAGRRPETPGRPRGHFITTRNNRGSTFPRHSRVRGRAQPSRVPSRGTAVALPARVNERRTRSTRESTRAQRTPTDAKGGGWRSPYSPASSPCPWP